MTNFEKWAKDKFGFDVSNPDTLRDSNDMLTYFRLSACWDAATEQAKEDMKEPTP